MANPHFGVWIDPEDGEAWSGLRRPVFDDGLDLPVRACGDWHRKAMCATSSLPFADVGDPLARITYEQRRNMQSYCERCTVRELCLLEALEEEDGLGVVRRFGLRGGLTPVERSHMANAAGRVG